MKTIILILCTVSFATAKGQQDSIKTTLNSHLFLNGNTKRIVHFSNEKLNIQPTFLNFFKEINKTPLFPQLLSDMNLNTQVLQQKQQRLIPNEQYFFVEIEHLKNNR